MALEPRGGQGRVNDDENLAVAWRRLDDLEDVPPLHRRAIEWACAQDPSFGGTARGAFFLNDGEVVESR